MICLTSNKGSESSSPKTRSLPHTLVARAPLSAVARRRRIQVCRAGIPADMSSDALPSCYPCLRMELALQVHVELLPEGVYLATCEELPGLVAQGRTIAETLEIARDVARKLIEARRERGGSPPFAPGDQRSDFMIVVGA